MRLETKGNRRVGERHLDGRFVLEAEEHREVHRQRAAGVPLVLLDVVGASLCSRVWQQSLVRDTFVCDEHVGRQAGRADV